jgi:glucosamine kinase
VTAASLRVAIDLGGTGARVSVEGGPRRRVFEGPGWDAQTGALGHLAELVERAATAEGDGERRLFVTAGLTGLNGVVPPIATLGSILNEKFGVDSLVVADDSLTSALGATGGKPGVVLAVGTGAVALGIGPGGEVARVDGGGAFLGDRGSGWWIGRQGLIAAFAKLEGREGGSADLLALAAKRYGLLPALPAVLRASPNPFREIALFSADVAQSARRGDLVSMRIFEHAGKHLATAVSAASLRSNQLLPVSVAVLGGVSRSHDLFFPTLFGELASRGIEAKSLKPQGDALSGAEALSEDRVLLPTDLVARWNR